MYKIDVKVYLQDGILDPQGKTVKNTLNKLGFDEIVDVRVAKHIDLFFNKKEDYTYERVKEMCEKLLANEVIEDFEVTEHIGFDDDDDDDDFIYDDDDDDDDYDDDDWLEEL